MARMDPHVLAHLEWLGFVRPTGLVVSAPALVRAGAILNRADAEGQRRLRDCLADPDAERPSIGDFHRFALEVLGWSWSQKFYAGTTERPIPEELEVTLPDYGETLRPDLAIAEPSPGEDGSPWQLLVSFSTPGKGLDDPFSPPGSTLEATAQGRMERLLRQTGVSAGVLFNGEVLRLVSAPRGESSGWLDFRVANMLQTAGRPICSAMRLLLSQHRLLAAGQDKRLAALLEDSRKFQNEVSERLAEQVLHALYELVRGFQAAHDRSRGALLQHVLADHPDEVYRGLLTVLLRMVFLLYAEERDMLPEDSAFLQHYSLAGLHERLREDAALNPDTMDQRYGAWAQLLVLFRMVFDGARWEGGQLPRRHGVLFDPDRFPFLEGRPEAGSRQIHERIEPPLVPDGTVYRVLEKLLVLDGERISYRALDVEQIGSVYETMMGFRLESATGRSVAIKAAKKYGAPSTVNLEALLAETPGKRQKLLESQAGRKIPTGVLKGVKEAANLEDLHAALDKVVDSAATPDLVPAGAMALQPSEERRKSGSHYTPRELTEPIVRTTLRPILERLREESGGVPTPEQILDLKVCDPAMGSGAFLVEACRQLGDALLEAWAAHGGLPDLPPDEDEVVFARRMVAQRCLYGVDRNPVAVDLAKVSLWLATLAKDHAFTFLDHALRHGDSLVGLSRRQIEAFHWDPDAPRFQAGFEVMRVQEHVKRVSDLRTLIREAGEDVEDWELRALWDEAEEELAKVRLFGDLVVAAFFEGTSQRERELKRGGFATEVLNGAAAMHQGWLRHLRSLDQPMVPFHWSLEFPEAFEREDPGFDAVVGNPPYLGGTRLEPAFGRSWRSFLVELIVEGRTGTRGAGDLAAYFLVRCFRLMRDSGCLGFVTTNSISQGDTRYIGLGLVAEAGGVIISADRSVRWPGRAGVEVTRIWLGKRGTRADAQFLDGQRVGNINSALRARKEPVPPVKLRANADQAFEGAKMIGTGFILGEPEAMALLRGNPDRSRVIRPYLSGIDVNSTVEGVPTRWAINFWDWPLDRSDPALDQRQPVAADYPECLRIVEERVRPERLLKPPTTSGNRAMRERWWQYYLWRPALYAAVAGKERVMVRSRVSNTHALVFVDPTIIMSDATVVFALEDWGAFCCLQCRVHEEWARSHASTMRNDLRYTPTSCYQTFPLPEDGTCAAPLADAGERYYSTRLALARELGFGLTAVYNRFHDPRERSPNIEELRRLHTAMDRAVLDAYGWTDIPTDCEFLLDYEDEDDEDSRRKKPWRYRWPDEVHDEVLARLLELNARRAEEERLAGGAMAVHGERGRFGGDDGEDDDASLDLFDD